MGRAGVGFLSEYQPSVGSLTPYPEFGVRITAHSYVPITGNYSCESRLSASRSGPIVPDGIPCRICPSVIPNLA